MSTEFGNPTIIGTHVQSTVYVLYLGPSVLILGPPEQIYYTIV
jgi:hypothetical protein